MSTRVRAAIAGLREGTLDAPKDIAHYLTRVLRMKEGSHFVAFDPATTREADAILETTSAAATRLRIGPLRDAAVSAPRPVTFIQGLAKGDKCDAVIRDATELGATHVIVAACARSVVQLAGERQTARLARWTRIASEAARQCGRADPPRVELLAWNEAIQRVSSDAHRFCLHVTGGTTLGPPLTEALQSKETALAFAAGPEGGLTDDEVLFAADHGWQIVSLGTLVLRTETAAAAVLGAVRVLG
jgi:16S rRNA (uracil1498-N3)-methyltransferase